MSQPFITIIVNNYNYARFLGAAIDSALAQSYPQCEVVVVDDGSTDHSRSLIAGYGERVIPLYRENGGQGAAFNTGFAASRGDLVVFLDADDWLLPDALARVAAVWRPELAKIHYQLRIQRGAQLTDELIVPRSLAQGDVAERQLRGGATAAPPTSGNAYARWALAALLPLPEAPWRLCADAFLNALVPLLGPVQAIQDPLGVYRVHGGNNWYRDHLDEHGCWQRALEQSVRLLSLGEVVGRVRGEGARARWLRSVGVAKARMVSAFPAFPLAAVPVARRWRLALDGLCSAPWAVHHSVPKRALIALWFVLAGVAPRPAQRFLALQALCPGARPRFVQKL